MIHFTDKGIFADTEEERLGFYDRLTAGDPVIFGHIAIHEKRQASMGRSHPDGMFYRRACEMMGINPDNNPNY